MNTLPNKDQPGSKALENTSKESKSDGTANAENQVSSDGSQPNPQDDMNSQKKDVDSVGSSPSDQIKNEK